MDDRERAGGAAQRGVEAAAAAVGALVEDHRRLDHDDRVELEALHDVEVEEVDARPDRAGRGVGVLDRARAPRGPRRCAPAGRRRRRCPRRRSCARRARRRRAEPSAPRSRPRPAATGRGARRAARASPRRRRRAARLQEVVGHAVAELELAVGERLDARRRAARSPSSTGRPRSCAARCRRGSSATAARARRTTIRSSIGVRFCASSITTWPNVRISGSTSQRASSKSATSVGVISRRPAGGSTASSSAISSSASRSPAELLQPPAVLEELAEEPVRRDPRPDPVRRASGTRSSCGPR